ncbi:hypothetical protein [Cyanobacterium aponinum]|uniref:Uncharacterized protein n=1 Tax=Cyanobacterium aponinum AL20115 TaxID=3090662 RepID=A0AAF0ZIG3_9CHRO|nr:hypothetical protein [Cyanobacterium aponinum]WPF88712.1 hypothetical protein SAY89_00085 [Cyanobacterium aponinum AL20115]
MRTALAVSSALRLINDVSTRENLINFKLVFSTKYSISHYDEIQKLLVSGNREWAMV